MTTKSISSNHKSIKNCTIQDCENKSYVKNYCIKHFQRFAKYGDPLFVKTNFGEGNTIEEKFWSRVALTANPDKCWEWQGKTNKYGYSQVKYKGKYRYVYALAWFLVKGAFSKLNLLHSCDNPKCVNPNHLREGTHQDNMQDMVNRNRQAKGEKIWTSKLTTTQVMEIKTLISNRIPLRQIAETFGVTWFCIYDIKREKNWKHI